MTKIKTQDISKIALCTALIIISAFISLPTIPPFTLQTAAIAFSGKVLGRKKGVICVLLYILLGSFGLPVFSGFRGGFAALFGATGGFILGFLPLGYFSGFGKTSFKSYLFMMAGLISCYILGMLWYALIYIGSFSSALSVIMSFVLPFIIPDMLKLFLALMLSARVKFDNF